MNKLVGPPLGPLSSIIDPKRVLIAWVILAILLCSFPAEAVSPPPDGGYANGSTAEGTDALLSLTSGYGNTAVGFNAVNQTTTAGYNTGVGLKALYSNTTGRENTATGAYALVANTTGTYNTATGTDALYHNTTGWFNTATGVDVLVYNTTGGNNTGNGVDALSLNTTGSGNTANGVHALNSNTSGNNNTANGVGALYCNTTAGDNTATGVNALYYAKTGGGNTATGVQALQWNQYGSQNTASGVAALSNNQYGSNNTAEGYNALLNVEGSNNIALGASAGSNLTRGSNNIDIGAVGSAGDSNTVRIGTFGTHTSAYVQGIYGSTVASGIAVIVNSNGQLGTTTSSERFKDNIKPMDKTSEAILGLNPVTFRYKRELDPNGIPQFGLVAEQVEKVDPDLVVRDAEGKVYNVRYDAVNAMLLNEFLKARRRIEQQDKRIEELTEQLTQQGALIQKVSDKVESGRPAPQMVSNTSQLDD